ncbi:MAG: segregation/condensation protein A [Clostridiaceae bacterium]|nr:MAG: segregation/condensation protein A [Clostridiaceae bacterium]
MNIKINDFDGPLDLLWYLIKAHKMDIYDINIEKITKEYLSFINEHKELTIDGASEYLVMASELIHLKSKLLLNNNDEEEDAEYEINTEEDLRNRLIEYEKLKAAADRLVELEDKRKEVLTKLPSNLSEYADKSVKLSSDITLDDLLKAFEGYLNRKKLDEPVNKAVTKRELSVEDRCLSIKSYLHNRGKVNFLDLFDEVDKPYVIVTFLGILNLVKSREAVISQEYNFGDIYIEERLS